MSLGLAPVRRDLDGAVLDLSGRRCLDEVPTGHSRRADAWVQDMQVTFQAAGAASVATIRGRLDSNSAAGVERDLLAAVGTGATRLVVDLGEVDYISSAGLRVMLIVAKRLKQGNGRFVLCSMKPHVSEVFEISGFHAIMTIAETREAALATMS